MYVGPVGLTFFFLSLRVGSPGFDQRPCSWYRLYGNERGWMAGKYVKVVIVSTLSCFYFMVVIVFWECEHGQSNSEWSVDARRTLGGGEQCVCTLCSLKVLLQVLAVVTVEDSEARK